MAPRPKKKLEFFNKGRPPLLLVSSDESLICDALGKQGKNNTNSIHKQQEFVTQENTSVGEEPSSSLLQLSRRGARSLNSIVLPNETSNESIPASTDSRGKHENLLHEQNSNVRTPSFRHLSSNSKRKLGDDAAPTLKISTARENSSSPDSDDIEIIEEYVNRRYYPRIRRPRTVAHTKHPVNNSPMPNPKHMSVLPNHHDLRGTSFTKTRYAFYDTDQEISSSSINGERISNGPTRSLRSAALDHHSFMRQPPYDGRRAVSYQARDLPGSYPRPVIASDCFTTDQYPRSMYYSSQVHSHEHMTNVNHSPDTRANFIVPINYSEHPLNRLHNQTYFKPRVHYNEDRRPDVPQESPLPQTHYNDSTRFEAPREPVLPHYNNGTRLEVPLVAPLPKSNPYMNRNDGARLDQTSRVPFPIAPDPKIYINSSNTHRPNLVTKSAEPPKRLQEIHISHKSAFVPVAQNSRAMDLQPPQAPDVPLQSSIRREERTIKPSMCLPEASNSFCSSPQEADQSATEKKRYQTCRLCHNHGVVTPIRGHKYVCPYIKCTCTNCKVTFKRRHFVKEQLKITRRQNTYWQNGQDATDDPAPGPVKLPSVKMNPFPQENVMIKDLALFDDLELFEGIDSICRPQARANQS
ncbi:uncharacterized protein LOC108673966 [Hyalella azteca]|uniref:Uncharacterized protein LOC108673966 n=1 Tax=Hyalella azteca TaxID=294128 RepID=A0A8B7NUE5_HYAAZ|nr:uncharacterized protein LOC108673966 [Hyalella azteca]